MAGEWRASTWGEEISLEYGKALRDYDKASGKYRVFGSNGPIGWTDKPLASGPGVILGRKGAYRGVEFSRAPFFVIDTAYYVVPKSEFDMRWLYYAIKHHKLGEIDDGSPIPSTTRSAVYVRDFDVPPLAEQKAIAAVLGALDEKIELNRRMNATLETMARALFQSWFVDFDPVRAKLDGRAPATLDPATASLFPEHIDRSEDFPRPKGWKSSRLGDHVDLVRGNTYKSKLKDLPGPYLFGLGSIHRNGGFRNDSLRTYGGESAPKLILRPGDLFASLKDVTQAAHLLGAVARVPVEIPAGRLTQDTVKLVPRDTGISFAYLYRTLLHPEYREYCRGRATGTTNLGLSREDFLNYPVLVPPKPIQDAFDAFDSRVEFKIANNRIQSSTLATLRDTLLPKLLRGELSVNNLKLHKELLNA